MQSDGPDLRSEEFAGTAACYLTVRCSNPACARLIAFQKAKFGCDHPDLRLAVTGKLSVACPHCKQLVRFRSEQIERRNVVLIQ